MFGRPPRDTGLESERNNRPTAAQRLHLLNSSHIQRKIEQSRMIQYQTRGDRPPREIANAHTIFNVVNLLVFIWFIGPLARLLDGDVIRIDAARGTLEALLAPEALAARPLASRPSSGCESGTGRELFGLMRRTVGPAERGASFLFAD